MKAGQRCSLFCEKAMRGLLYAANADAPSADSAWLQSMGHAGSQLQGIAALPKITGTADLAQWQFLVIPRCLDLDLIVTGPLIQEKKLLKSMSETET